MRRQGVKATGWRRHFEGWQAGLVAVLIALGVAILVVPRPVTPHGVPAPVIDRLALERVALADERLAEQAAEQPLPHDVRALGGAVRAFGAADAAGDERGLVDARTRMVDAARRSLAHGIEPLLMLRAYQTRTFLDALEEWRWTGQESADLVELGGGILSLLRRHRWVDEAETPIRILASRPALRAMFKKRWNEITGLTDGEPTRLALDEERALARFLLRYPTLPAGLERRRPLDDPRATFENEYLLRKIDDLAALDSSYPAAFARGIVLYRLRRYDESIRAFQAHLDAHPDGPYTLRVQNFLRAAIGKAQGEDW